MEIFRGYTSHLNKEQTEGSPSIVWVIRLLGVVSSKNQYLVSSVPHKNTVFYSWVSTVLFVEVSVPFLGSILVEKYNPDPLPAIYVNLASHIQNLY